MEIFLQKIPATVKLRGDWQGRKNGRLCGVVAALLYPDDFTLAAVKSAERDQ